MRLVFAALVASTGCAQLFGIDETTAVDANVSLASIQVQRVSVGATVEKDPQDMSSQMATFYDDSAGTLAPVPGVLAGTDTFTGAAAGNPSAIFTVPDTIVPTRMWALPARTQRGNFVQYEHPNPQPALPSSAFDVIVTLPTPYVTGESFAIQAIGAWMTRTLVAADLPTVDTMVSTIDPPAPIPYSMFVPIGPNVTAWRVTLNDVVVLLRYTANRLSGVFQTQLEQTDGPDLLMGTMTAVQANSTLMATLDPPGFTTRFAAARPAVAGLAMSWRVNAAPGHAVAVDTGVRLNSGALTTETSLMTTYGNPFESLDWRAVFLFTASASRSYTYSEGGMMAAVGLSASFSTTLTTTEPATTVNLANAAGLPITIEANQATLVTDGMTLTIDPAQPVVVEATLDRPTNTAYQLTLVQLGLDTSGMAPVVTRTIVVDAITAGMPTFKLPPTLFTAGKSYYFTFRAIQGGLSDAASGDTQTPTLPVSYAALDSAVFTVGMP